jgi:PAS domain S-box-containing protein
MLDEKGLVATWNAGAQRLEGYSNEEIEGLPFSTFFTPEDVAAGVPGSILKHAEAEGQVQNEGWRVRKDGSRFWTRGVVTALRDETGRLQGFAKIAHDQTQEKNPPRKSFSSMKHWRNESPSGLPNCKPPMKSLKHSVFPVSHDLRSPLRHIADTSKSSGLRPAPASMRPPKRHLKTIADAAQHMGDLIDALLAFSRMGRGEMQKKAREPRRDCKAVHQ